MDEELRKLQKTWQQGPAEIDAGLRRATLKAERNLRWGRWLLLASLPLFFLLLLPSLFGWGGIVESTLVLALGAVGLSLGVVAVLRWPGARSGPGVASSVKDAIEAMLGAREHRLWLWTGWP